MIAVVALPLLLFLPGLVTLGWPLSRDRGGNGPAGGGEAGSAESSRDGWDVLETAALWIGASFLISSLVAFVLVMLGVFSLWLLLSLLSAYTVTVAALAGRLPRRWPALDRGQIRARMWPVLGAAAAIAGALALYSGYSETVLLFRDPATHVNTAVHIAETGGSLIEDELYYSLDDDLQTALVFKIPVESVRDRFGGFQIDYRFKGFPKDPRLGQTTPQFFNLFPTWQAIGHGMFGMRGVFLVSPLFGALSIVFIFRVGRRLFGAPAGVVAALLLSVNLAQFWYARVPASEVVTQTVFLIAMLFWVVFTATRDRLDGVFAGIGFGALFLLRVDSVLVLGALAVFFCYVAATRRIRRRDLFFFVPLVVVAGLGLVDALYSSRLYVEFLYRGTPHATPLLSGLGLAMVASLAIGAFPRLRVSATLRSLQARHASSLKVALAVGLIAAVVFAYYVRPSFDEPAVTGPFGETLPSYDGDSLVRLGWYLSPIGIALATIGGVIAIARTRNRGLGLFLLIGLVAAVYYLIDPRVRPDHFWEVRRFVPIIIPWALLLVAASVRFSGSWRLPDPECPPRGEGTRVRSMLYRMVRSRLARRVLTPGLTRGVATGAVVGVLVLSVTQVWSFVSYRDWEGSTEQVELVASRFPENAVIVFEGAFGGTMVAPPLKLIHGLETFVLGSQGTSGLSRTICDEGSDFPSADHPRSCILQRLAEAASTRPFYWVAENRGRLPEIVAQRFSESADKSFRISVPKLEQPLDRLPRRSGAVTVGLSGFVYELDRTSDFSATGRTDDRGP